MSFVQRRFWWDEKSRVAPPLIFPRDTELLAVASSLFCVHKGCLSPPGRVYLAGYHGKSLISVKSQRRNIVQVVTRSFRAQNMLAFVVMGLTIQVRSILTSDDSSRQPALTRESAPRPPCITCLRFPMPATRWSYPPYPPVSVISLHARCLLAV